MSIISSRSRGVGLIKSFGSGLMSGSSLVLV
jgi:hypothetical protein